MSGWDWLGVAALIAGGFMMGWGLRGCRNIRDLQRIARWFW